MARVRKRKLPKGGTTEPLAIVVPPIVDEREALFVQYLLADRTMSVVNAYIRAGYAPDYARKNAYNKYAEPQIQEALRLAQEDLQKRIQWEQYDIINEFRIIGHSDVRDFTVDAAGNLTLREGVPEEAWRAVRKVKHRVRTDREGNTTREVEFELWDKPAALKAGGEHLGMFVQRIEVTTPQGTGVLAVPIGIGVTDWEQIATAQQAALKAAVPVKVEHVE